MLKSSQDNLLTMLDTVEYLSLVGVEKNGDTLCQLNNSQFDCEAREEKMADEEKNEGGEEKKEEEKKEGEGEGEGEEDDDEDDDDDDEDEEEDADAHLYSDEAKLWSLKNFGDLYSHARFFEIAGERTPNDIKELNKPRPWKVRISNVKLLNLVQLYYHLKFVSLKLPTHFSLSSRICLSSLPSDMTLS